MGVQAGDGMPGMKLQDSTFPCLQAERSAGVQATRYGLRASLGVRPWRQVPPGAQSEGGVAGGGGTCDANGCILQVVVGSLLHLPVNEQNPHGSSSWLPQTSGCQLLLPMGLVPTWKGAYSRVESWTSSRNSRKLSPSCGVSTTASQLVGPPSLTATPFAVAVRPGKFSSAAAS